MFFVSDASLDAILADDLPYGDETTSLFLQGSQQGALVAEAKTEGIVCGVALAARLLRRLGSVCDVHVEDGSYVPAHAPLLCARGSVEQLLGAYKMAQVIMEYTTGIARRTAAMVAAAERVSPNCRIALTRKHFPGAKRLSLYAALCAGGTLHRSSLSESVLLFDAHRTFLEDPLVAVRSAKARSAERRIAVEVDTPDEALAYLDAGADIIQCERFSPKTLTALVSMVRARYPAARILATGGLNAENAAVYASTGVDALVTSWPYFAPPADVKMRFSRP